MTLRQRLMNIRFAAPRDLTGKNIIVTGASPGSLGFAIAGLLADWGAEVTVTSRQNPPAMQQTYAQRLPDGLLRCAQLDLCDPRSVTGFAAAYQQQHDTLDVLINCAGIHLDLRSQWTEPRLSADGYEIHWRSNYLGTCQLTDVLLPLLRKRGEQTGDARIVNIVSQLHNRGHNEQLFGTVEHYNSWQAYGNSKLALMHATFEWQKRYQQHGVQSYCLHPGAVFTNIADKGLAGQRGLLALRKCFAPLEALFLLSPEEGAQTALYCATAPQLQGGRYFRNCASAPHSADAADREVSQRLWQQTRRWLDAVNQTASTLSTSAE